MSKVVQLFEKASEEHKEERMSDRQDRRLLACVIACAICGVLLFGAVCFDIGLRVGAALCS